MSPNAPVHSCSHCGFALPHETKAQLRCAHTRQWKARVLEQVRLVRDAKLKN